MFTETDIKEKFLVLIDDFPALLFSFHPQKGVLIWNKECIHSTGILAKDVVLNPDALQVIFGDKERVVNIVEKLESGSLFEYRDTPMKHTFQVTVIAPSAGFSEKTEHWLKVIFIGLLVKTSPCSPTQCKI